MDQDFPLNRIELTRFLESFFSSLSENGAEPKADLKPFFNIVISLKRDIHIPLLRELSALGTGREAGSEYGVIKKRLDRVYLRMRRVQEELGRLDLRKAAPGVSAEDFIFSSIDFSKYREIEAEYFETLFSAGYEDFDEGFLEKNVGLGRGEIKSLIEKSYKKTAGVYRIQNENPVILSVMRSLEMSLETMPLFTAGEIEEELKKLKALAQGERSGGKLMNGMKKLYALLVTGLDGAVFTHRDGMKTKLFLAGQGNLSGTFTPAGKPWTRVLIPRED